ncbi:olfactory receptor 5G3-like [Trichosurus vulpecula]|uniref:olfactory receptor 5G3-like n=1 Tax=Trichosurus vulpecula TaxID=9337 RepID=UPI00186AF535|nr:olfactory receptor 5G3-like [Trichosurus vulpecula]
MEARNQTMVTEFLFVGFTEYLQQQVLLFLMFMFVYLITVFGNLGMIILIWKDSQLHTPMYFFLSHLSFVDFCSSSTIAPKMLADFFVEKKTISFLGCAAQMWFFGLFLVSESFLLTAMAYDRYVAICNPLLYTLVMSQSVCVQLVIGPYAMGLLSCMTHTILIFHLPFCDQNVINHFFCDVSPLLSLACADTHIIKLILSIIAGAVGVFSGLTILISYIYIFMAILRIRSASGRSKAFSTCSSHLTTVSIMYGTLFFIYVRPSANFSLDLNKILSVFYTALTPMLNPLIYSLRNKEVKNAFRRNLERKKFLCANKNEVLL